MAAAGRSVADEEGWSREWVALGGAWLVAAGGTAQHRTLGLTIPNQALVGFVAISLAVGYVVVCRGALASADGSRRGGRAPPDGERLTGSDPVVNVLVVNPLDRRVGIAVDPEQVGRTVTVRGAKPRHRVGPVAVVEGGGDGTLDVAGGADVVDDTRLGRSEQVVDVPVTGVALATSEFAVALDAGEPTSAECAADVCVGAGGQFAITCRAEPESSGRVDIDEQRVRASCHDRHVCRHGNADVGSTRRAAGTRSG